MGRALELARRGDYLTSPNPMVGALLVRDGEVVGEGFHQHAGGPHAEVVALESAGGRARGASLWVSLEPCCLSGRTGPCTERILAAGVAEVHVATLDPNPRVQGRGVDQLRRAGLEVVVGERAEEAEALIAEFGHWVTTGLPWVTLKFAMTLDGKVASREGRSRWITSETARARAHRLRSQHDAILVGAGTLLADDPQLNLRWGLEERPQPLRVVADSGLRTPSSARLLQPGGGAVVVATCDPPEPARARALERAGAEVLALPPGPGGVSLTALLRDLGRRAVTSLLVEGGPTLLGSFMEQRLGQRLVAFVAPLVLGGSMAPGPFAGQGAAGPDQGWRARRLRAEPVGPDLLLVAEV